MLECSTGAIPRVLLTDPSMSGIRLRMSLHWLNPALKVLIVSSQLRHWVRHAAVGEGNFGADQQVRVGPRPRHSRGRRQQGRRESGRFQAPRRQQPEVANPGSLNLSGVVNLEGLLEK